MRHPRRAKNNTHIPSPSHLLTLCPFNPEGWIQIVSKDKDKCHDSTSTGIVEKTHRQNPDIHKYQ